MKKKIIGNGAKWRREYASKLTMYNKSKIGE